MGNAKKLPSGKWRARATWYSKDGNRHSKSFTADTKKEANYLASEYIIMKNERESDSCRIEDAVDRFIESRENTLSPSTIRSYRQIQKNYYKELNGLPVADVTSEDIQKYIDNLAKSRSPKTIRNVYGLLNSAITAVNPNIIIRVHLPAKKVLTYHTPTDAQVRLLLEGCDRSLRIAVLLASIGTLRRGEICALKFGDINGNIIHVHADKVHAANGDWIYKDIPKTNSSDRYIEFPQKIIDEIGSGAPEEYIIKLCPDTITKKFIILRDSCGISCRFHDLRHYAASIMHALGIPDQYIMARGGWSSDGILKSVYRNTLSDENKKFSDIANHHFEDLF